jgi:O-antigen/teichoic acid export membrane protein
LKFFEKDILWSTFVQLLGKGLHIGIGIVCTKLLTSHLEPSGYGAYGKIAEFALFFSVAGNLGLFGNSVRRFSESPKDIKLLLNTLLLRFFSAMAFYAVGVMYGIFSGFELTFLAGMLLFMSSLLLDQLVTICDGFLQAHYKMGRAVIAHWMGRLAQLLALVLLTLNPENILSNADPSIFFLAPLAASAMSLTWSLGFVAKNLGLDALKETWRQKIVDLKFMKGMLLSSLPFGIINLINNLYYRFLPSLLIAKMVTEAVYGSYSLTLHMAGTASLLSTLLMFSSLPKISQSLEWGLLQEARDLYHRLKNSLWALSIVMVISGSLLAPLAIPLVSNSSFLVNGYGFILPMLLVLTAASYLYDLAMLTLFGLKQEMWFLKREPLALLLASGFFLVAYFVLDNPILQVSFTLLGAIAGESLMAALGMWRLRGVLKD